MISALGAEGPGFESQLPPKSECFLFFYSQQILILLYYAKSVFKLMGLLIKNNKVYWSYSVVVSTPDFESGDLGSNPSKTFFLILNQQSSKKDKEHCILTAISKIKPFIFDQKRIQHQENKTMMVQVLIEYNKNSRSNSCNS